MSATSYHSICRWTFNAGKGGFLPGNIRPDWAADKFGSKEMVELVAEKVKPRLPDNVALGIELHYDTEICENTADAVATAMVQNSLHLAMVTPGAHSHHAYGGPASLDPQEREAATALARRTVDIAYGPLKKTWHPEASMVPTLVLWNGSFGYDVATIGLKEMYENLMESIADLCKYEEGKGGELFFGLEPKPNEGHPAMLIPTVASGLLFWRKIEDKYNIPRERNGLNMEFGHSEMIGLDHLHDVIEQLQEDSMTHIHLNSQGYNDGIIYGGPGKYDIDHGTRINGMNIAIAGLMQDYSYTRWKGHDMQPRGYDNEQQAIDRVVRSILSWEACEHAAKAIDNDALLAVLRKRETAEAEDIMRNAVVEAQQWFNEQYSA